MASFNFDMDKYIDKRRLGESIEQTSIRPKKKIKSKKLIALLNLKNTIKMLLDADEIINFTDLDEKSNVTVYEKKNFKDKLGDFIKHSKSVKVGIPIQEENDIEIIPKEDIFKGTNISENKISDFITTTSKTDQPKKILKIEQVKETPVNSMLDILSKADQKIHERDIPKKRIEKDIRDNRIREDGNHISSHYTERHEYREDLREIIKIMYRVIKKVPPETLKHFKESDDYNLFVKILDKYDLIKK